MRETIAAWNLRTCGGMLASLQHAVDAIADAELVLERLDVDVRRPQLERLGQDLVDELDDRRVLGGGRGQVEVVVVLSSMTWSRRRRRSRPSTGACRRRRRAIAWRRGRSPSAGAGAGTESQARSPAAARRARRYRTPGWWRPGSRRPYPAPAGAGAAAAAGRGIWPAIPWKAGGFQVHVRDLEDIGQTAEELLLADSVLRVLADGGPKGVVERFARGQGRPHLLGRGVVHDPFARKNRDNVVHYGISAGPDRQPDRALIYRERVEFTRARASRCPGASATRLAQVDAPAGSAHSPPPRGASPC